MQTILFNFASRNRPDKFVETIQNIAAMCAREDYVILAKLDEDDDKLTAYSRSLFHTAYCIGTSKNKIDAINRHIPEPYNDIFEVMNWDILVNISDDMKFTLAGFDDIIRANCGPDDFVHFPDQYAGERVCTMSVMGWKYYLRDNYVYHPSYYSLWCDNEAQDVARLRGRYKFVNLQIVRHDHYTAGLSAKDALYMRNDTYQADKLIYEQRKLNNFP